MSGGEDGSDRVFIRFAYLEPNLFRHLCKTKSLNGFVPSSSILMNGGANSPVIFQLKLKFSIFDVLNVFLLQPGR